MLHNTSSKLTVIESHSEDISKINTDRGSIIFTENGGMYYSNTNGVRRRIDDNRIVSTPQLFGAKADWDPLIAPDVVKSGDTSTDDSQAFQSAINSGKHVYIPCGNYKLSKPVIIDQDNTHITIDGTIAISAFEGFIIHASDVTLDGNGTIMFYGRKTSDDIGIRGSAIVIESTYNNKLINVMRTTIGVRLEKPSQYPSYDYINYSKYDNVEYQKNEYDCIAVQVRSNNTSSEPAGIFPVVVNSTINNFRTGIAIRKSDLHCFDSDGNYTKNWCTGLEFNGTIENCLCAIDNEIAGGSHIRGAIQPPPIKDAKKRNTYNSPPLVRIPEYTFIDSKLWDLHIMANRYALEITGEGSIVACTTLQSKYINRPRYDSNIHLINKNADPYSVMQISSCYNSHYFTQYDNILENAIYNSTIHCSFYGERGIDKEDSGYGIKWCWGGDGSGGITFKNMFLSKPIETDFYRMAKNTDEINIKVSISFDTPQSLKGLAVCGDFLPDEIKFVFYSKNTDSNGNPLTAEIIRYANHTDETGNIVGDYDKNLRGALSYATWEWDWYIATENPLMWGNLRNVATITKVDIHLINYQVTEAVNYKTLIGKISSIFAMTGESTYITKNGGVISGELSVPTPTAQSSNQAVVNKEYMNTVIGDINTALDSIIASQQILIGGDNG